MPFWTASCRTQRQLTNADDKHNFHWLYLLHNMTWNNEGSGILWFSPYIYMIIWQRFFFDLGIMQSVSPLCPDSLAPNFKMTIAHILNSCPMQDFFAGRRGAWLKRPNGKHGNAPRQSIPPFFLCTLASFLLGKRGSEDPSRENHFYCPITTRKRKAFFQSSLISKI